jgi:hypothetical protein
MVNPSLEELTDRLRARTASLPPANLLAADSVWNLSQTVQHCAQTIGYSVIGYPKLKSKLFRGTLGFLAKRVFLWRGATRHSLGAEIDGAPPLNPAVPVSEAVAQLAEAVERFSAHRANHAPHPAYGRCSHEDYAALHAMHVVEHLPGLER